MRVFSGGYFFVGAAARPAYAGSKVLPELLWTPTSCICELYPEYWAFSWCNPPQEEIDSAISHLGLNPSDFQPLQEWVEQQFEVGGVGFPGVLLRHEVALEFAAKFLRAGPEIKLIGIGLPEAYVEEFLSEAEPGPGEGPPGVYQAVESRGSLAEGGVPLGFEPLGYDYGGFHSFICNSLEADYSEELNLTINENARFSEFAACELAVQYTRLDSTGAEPALWQPWLVVEYPRAAA
jgi:hypothetical protein